MQEQKIGTGPVMMNMYKFFLPSLAGPYTEVTSESRLPLSIPNRYIFDCFMRRLFLLFHFKTGIANTKYYYIYCRIYASHFVTLSCAYGTRVLTKKECHCIIIVQLLLLWYYFTLYVLVYPPSKEIIFPCSFISSFSHVRFSLLIYTAYIIIICTFLFVGFFFSFFRLSIYLFHHFINSNVCWNEIRFTWDWFFRAGRHYVACARLICHSMCVYVRFNAYLFVFIQHICIQRYRWHRQWA